VDYPFMVNAEAFAFTCLLPVCARDDPNHFREALLSIADASLPPRELILCQDGPLPEALERVVVSHGEARGARRLINTGPPGLHHNLNRALAMVSTPWLCRADADDVNLPLRFEAQVRFLKENLDIDVLGAGLEEFWPDGRTRAKIMPQSHDAIVRWARFRNPINHMTAFVRVEAMQDCGGYPDIPLKEDYGLWLTMMGKGYRFANLAAPLVRARLGADFYRRRSGVRHLASEISLFRLKRKMLGMGPMIAAGALIARAGALASKTTARAVYETMLRR
jgi:glycosyltransferase involved in cell wall biosynthesis